MRVLPFLLLSAACTSEYSVVDLPHACPEPDGFGVGHHFASAGDVNDDGYDDVVVGSNGGWQANGHVCVLLGGPRGVTGEALPLVEGDPGQRMGEYVDGLGDVNGDGYADIGATSYAGFDESAPLRVFLGSADGLVASGWEVDGRGFTERIQGVGDIDQDGFDDVLVVRLGQAELYHGGPDGLSSAPAWVVGGDRYDFGTSSGSAGDVDGDGFPDVFVTTPTARRDGSDALDGRVDIWHGSPDGLASTPDTVLFGQATMLGQTGATGGDLDQDGYDDLLLTDNCDRGLGPCPDSKQLHLYRGGPTGLVQEPLVVPIPFAVEGYGLPVAMGVGDVDADGRPDVLLNRELPWESTYGTSTVVELWSFGPDGFGPNGWSQTWLGHHRVHFAPGGDFNGDRRPDVLIGEDDGVFGTDLYAVPSPLPELPPNDYYAR